MTIGQELLPLRTFEVNFRQFSMLRPNHFLDAMCDDYGPFPSPAPHTTTSQHLPEPLQRDPDPPDPMLRAPSRVDLCPPLGPTAYVFR